MAVYREAIKAYESKDKHHRWYTHPFTQAKDVAEEWMGELLDKIIPLAETIYRNREDRNSIVHEITTEIGQRERTLTRQRRKDFDAQQVSGFVKRPVRYEDMQARFTEAQALHAAELSKATDQVVSWYRTLVEMSSYVFQVENGIRRRRGSVVEAPQVDRR